MTGGGVSGSDMPSLPWTARQDVSPAEDTSLSALLAGNGLPAGADSELRPVADVLATLMAHPAGDELTGLAAARAEFRRQVVAPIRVRRSPRRRRGGLASRLGAKAGAAAALVAVGVGGAAVAAYADVLPVSWQQFAHHAIGAPERGAGRETQAGAAGPAAYRPCAAYQRALAHGTAGQQAAALRILAKAAGGAGKVSAWCAAEPSSLHPPLGASSSGPPAGEGSRYAGPTHHAGPPGTRPSAHRSVLPGAPAAHTTPDRLPWDGADPWPVPRG